MQQTTEATATRTHKTHVVKCWPEFFAAIKDGVKTFDLRRDDRDYQVGDDMVQEEYRGGTGEYTGRELRCKITFIARGYSFEKFGLAPGFCCLAIKLI